MSTFHTINPATGEPIAEYTYATQEEISTQLEATYRAWKKWKTTFYPQRAEKLLTLAKLLIEQKTSLGRLITHEMGKPVNESISEIEKCAWVCEYYAENGQQFLTDEQIKTEAQSSVINFEPLGIVLAIMPWNFPFWQVFRFAAPGLMAGNACILKHSSNTIGCALKIHELFEQAGFPTGLLASMIINSRQIEYVISHEKIAAVTLTGSVGAGKSVGALAGKYLKKSVLELGGSDAYVICDDADLDLAAKCCVEGRLKNTGQSCIAAKRFIVTRQNLEIFTEKVKTLMSDKKMLDPMDENCELGPMAREDLRDELHEQVQNSIKAGAKCELGGEIPDKKGFYYPATLLTGVTKGMPAYEEELFGPVAAIIPAESEEDALDIANDNRFGLGAAVFSQNINKARLYATERIDAGCCFVNDFVRSDPRLPFGGVKESGYGRELSSYGIKEFVNIKSIYIK